MSCRFRSFPSTIHSYLHMSNPSLGAKPMATAGATAAAPLLAASTSVSAAPAPSESDLGLPSLLLLPGLTLGMCGPRRSDWVMREGKEVLWFEKEWPAGPRQMFFGEGRKTSDECVQLLRSGLAEQPHHPQAHIWHAALSEQLSVCTSSSASLASECEQHVRTSLLSATSSNEFLALSNFKR
jgi:hypothetical protein